jgi:hypothetical protein
MTRPIAPIAPTVYVAHTAFAVSLALATSLLAVPAAQADVGGRCHFHGNKPASQAVVTDCADQRKATLVKAGKLDASWQAIQQEKAELVDGKKGKEWKITFNNPGAPDPGKRTLYLFFSQPGNFIAANHTGK